MVFYGFRNGPSGFDETSETGSSVGDVKIGLAKTLARERGARPDLVARIVWDTDTGDQMDGDVSMGLGFDQLRVSLSALKRQDPLVFTATGAYEYTFEEGEVKPGDAWALSLGTSLAASPDTSLSASLIQRFSSRAEIDGRSVDGTDQVSGVLALGASSIVGRRTLIAFSVAVGVTDDAPDYAVSLAVPVRF
ncbi:hypothetical protein CKO15_11560 [Halorhodospira abdelmalekii]|nr:hypothetical protein [Halorhodospira abdelmalekii]